LPGEESLRSDIASCRQQLGTMRESLRKLEEEERALESSLLALQTESLPGEANAGVGVPCNESAETASPVGDSAPQVEPPPDGKQAAGRLAEELVENLAQSLSIGENRVLEWVEKILAALWEDLERQGSSTRSLAGTLEERLQPLEEALFSLQDAMREHAARLDQQAQTIRSTSEAQAGHAAMIGQLLEVLRRLVSSAECPPPPESGTRI
jgi:DNA repair exonuclease SbcCD ATPase subunit